MASTPTSETGISTDRSGRSAAGFSLLELMVVVAIIGFMAGAVLLSSDLGGEQRIQEREAYRLRGLLELMREEALMQNRDFAVELTETGYRFLQYDYARLQWLPSLNERLFVDYRLPDDNLHLELALEGRFTTLEQEFEQTVEDDGEHEPQLLVFSSGEITPFELEFRFGENNGLYALTGQLDGSLEVLRRGFSEP